MVDQIAINVNVLSCKIILYSPLHIELLVLSWLSSCVSKLIDKVLKILICLLGFFYIQHIYSYTAVCMWPTFNIIIQARLYSVIQARLPWMATDLVLIYIYALHLCVTSIQQMTAKFNITPGITIFVAGIRNINLISIYMYNKGYTR